MTKKTLSYMTIIIVIFLMVLALIYLPKQANSQKKSSDVTVFVHGYKGTGNSFNGMLTRFQKNNWGSKSLVCYVSKSGHVKTYSLKHMTDKPKFVQVVMANNRASFQDTAGWLAKVMHILKVKYHVDSLNIVGHSMGGIASLKYLEDYNDPLRYPTTQKLVTIGSPFGGILKRDYFRIHHDAGAHDLRPGSKALHTLQGNVARLPKHTQFYSIASIGDPVATPESVAQLGKIVPPDQLKAKVLENKRLGHSQLHESKLVDQWIYRILWQKYP